MKTMTVWLLLSMIPGYHLDVLRFPTQIDCERLAHSITVLDKQKIRSVQCVKTNVLVESNDSTTSLRGR